MKPVVVLRAADEELVEAARFYEKRSGGLGTEFLEETQLYKEEETEIVVVAVMHLRRRPDYWRNR